MLKGGDDIDIGSRIKNQRLKLGLSVEEVAKKLNKNKATVYRYESNDIKNLPTAVLGPLARVLKTTPTQLLGWFEPLCEDNVIPTEYPSQDDNLKIQQMVQEICNNKELQDLFDASKNLSSNDIRIVTDMVKRFKTD